MCEREGFYEKQKNCLPMGLPKTRLLYFVTPVLSKKCQTDQKKITDSLKYQALTLSNISF